MKFRLNPRPTPPTTPAPIEAYLRALEHALKQHGLVDARVVEEARGHLVDAMDQALQRGLPVEAAAHEAFARFGTPDTIADTIAATIAADRAAHGTADGAAARRSRMSRRLLVAATTVAEAILAIFGLPIRHIFPPRLAGPRRHHWAIVERGFSHAIFQPTIPDAGNAGIADAAPQQTDTMRQLIVGAAQGTVNPALIASPGRAHLVPNLEALAPGLSRLGPLDSLTLLEEKHVRRYRAVFASGVGVVTAVHAADGTLLWLVRMESSDEPAVLRPSPTT